MKIKKLIKIFEKCLKNYQKGYDEKYDRFDIIFNNLELGICFHCKKNLDTFQIYHLFDTGYYRKIRLNYEGYLFNLPYTYKELLPRINWLKEEIKDLNKLLKKGYTEV